MSTSAKTIRRTIGWAYPGGDETHEWTLTQHSGSDTFNLYHNKELIASGATDFLPDLAKLLTEDPEKWHEDKEDGRVEYGDRSEIEKW